MVHLHQQRSNPLVKRERLPNRGERKSAGVLSFR
jgi:hypothetical protein